MMNESEFLMLRTVCNHPSVVETFRLNNQVPTECCNIRIDWKRLPTKKQGLIAVRAALLICTPNKILLGSYLKMEATSSFAKQRWHSKKTE